MLTALAGSILVRALAWTLLHFLWQGVLLAAVLAVVLAALGRAGAAARHGAACVAMLLMALAPIATFWLLFTNLPAADGAGVFAAAAPAPAAGAPGLVVLLLAWLLGVALMTARLVGGLVHLRGIVTRHSEALAGAWQARLAELARGLGLRGAPRLYGSTRIDVPMVVGWLRPVILVPLGVLASLPASDLEAILAHELAHVRRRDYLVNILQSVVEIALFYHPAVHWVSGRIRVEREYCCDDAVLGLLGDPRSYARALLALETLRAEPPRLALASTGGSLLLRIRRIVAAPPSRSASARAWLGPALVLASTLALGVAGVSSCARVDEPRPPAALGAAVEPESEVDIPWLPAALARWKPTLVATAARHGVDPDALAIVTLVESCGDPAARSSSGAVGLMQLMPATAGKIADERGLPDPSAERLLDPEYNVDLGAWYFARQLDSFGTDDPGRSIELAAAAYNGGERRVRAYLDTAAPLSEETERYKALVVGMWNERRAPRSPTYDAWRARLRGASCASLREP